MDTLVRSTTVHFRRRLEGYQSLDNGKGASGEEVQNLRAFSVRNTVMTISLSFRRDRAKKRQIFLRTYRLVYSERRKYRKLKKVGIRLRSLFISAVSALRFNSPKSWSCRSAICVSSPSAVRN